MFDVEKIRKDFPILSQKVWGHPLVYLDNAATTQVPNCVLEACIDHYRTENANVHRGIHRLSNLSTKSYENARSTMARFINAPNDNCVVFTRGTTDGLNMAALGLQHILKPGDRVVTSMLEHHSNFVPWQQACKKVGAEFVPCKLTKDGDIDLTDLSKLLADGKTKIVALTCCSNVIGTVTPVEKIVTMAHNAGAICVFDAAQIMRHRIIDVDALGCDVLAFSGHKMMGPTGIGVLYIAPSVHDQLQPTAFGGEMVDEVYVDNTTFEQPPLRLEAGTPNFTGAIMLSRAAQYLETIGRSSIANYEDELINYSIERLNTIDGLTILGNPKHRSGCASFIIDGVHPLDLCTMVDKLGVALRSGNNCAQPLLRSMYNTPYVSRLSVAFYNTYDEIDRAIAAINQVADLLRKF